MRALTQGTGRALTIGIAAALSLLTGCEPNHDSPLGPLSGIDAEILDGQHGGNPLFFFLPPISSPPAVVGTFDPNQSPVVVVCEWLGTACGVTLAEFSRTAGTGGQTIKVSTTNQQYSVTWRVPSSLVKGQLYRIRVSLGGTELGHADAVVDGTKPKPVDTVPIKPGKNFQIKFRIDEGTVQPPPADFSGVWNGSWNGTGSNGTLMFDDWVLDLSQAADSVHGTATSPFSGVSAPLRGSVSGNTLSFIFTSVNGSYTIAYQGTGTFVGTDTMAVNGTADDNAGEHFTWSGGYRRAGAAAASQVAASTPKLAPGKSLIRGGRRVQF